MRLILLAVALTISVTGLVSGQSAKQRAAIEQEIRRLDVAHADAILRGDLVALDKLWTKDFKVNNPFNEIDKADRIRTGAVTYASFIRVPESVLIHGDTVIVMGREEVVPKGNSPDAGNNYEEKWEVASDCAASCTRIRCPSRISRVACSTPTTAGKPYSRAITAPWVIRPPTSVTRPLIATNRGVQLGSV
jgi:hypothetical protein